MPIANIINQATATAAQGLIDRQDRRYYVHEKALNSLIGMRSYEQVRCILKKATQELTVLDTVVD